VGIAGCGFLQSAAPLDCGFPDGTDLAFAGRTSLRQLALGDDSRLGDGRSTADLVGMVYVTRDPIPYAGSLPAGAHPPPDQRAYCAIYDEDAGIISAFGGVPVDWVPPGS
jgi:hypothetical protein